MTLHQVVRLQPIPSLTCLQDAAPLVARDENQANDANAENLSIGYVDPRYNYNNRWYQTNYVDPRYRVNYDTRYYRNWNNYNSQSWSTCSDMMGNRYPCNRDSDYHGNRDN